jgi:hypothetical protein
MSAYPVGGALAVLIAGIGSVAEAAPQATRPERGQNVEVSNGQGGRRRAMYGAPEFRALDDPQARPWPQRQAIRTRGRLEEIPGRRSPAGIGTDSAGPAPEWDSPYAHYQICGELACLAIVPVDEFKDGIANAAMSWLHLNVEVIGAIDKLDLPGIDPRKAPTVFQVWSVFEAPDSLQPRKSSGGATLEPLVRYPSGAQGRVVTVHGVFRGANLFEDLPAKSRRKDSDWVLQDGPFSIWVTGKDPKGPGFALDARSRADCRFRLEVTGKVSVVNDFIYLRASSVQMLGRANAE